MNVASACTTVGIHPHVREPFRAGPWLVGTDGCTLLAERCDMSGADGHPQTVTKAFDLLDDTGDGWRRAKTSRLRARMGRPLLPEMCLACSGTGRAAHCRACRGTGLYLGRACEGVDLRCAACACWRCDLDGYVERSLAAPDVVIAGEWCFDRRRIASALVHCDAASVEWRVHGETLQLRWSRGNCRAVVMRLQWTATEETEKL